MTTDEIENVVGIASKLGMKKVKITGGEPLARRDVVEIVGKAARLVDEVSMTTNGVLLERYSSDMSRNGLKRVNVSLDSLKPSTFKAITGADRMEDVLKGIYEAINRDLRVKLNVVMLRGVNTRELNDMVRFAAEAGAVLQLIELTTEKCNLNSRFFQRFHMDLENIERYFRRKASNIVFNELHRRKKYLVPIAGNSNGKAVCEVELVRPMHNTEFCAQCTRLRMTSDGKLKPCLLTNKGLVDIVGALRSNVGEEELETRFKQAINNRHPYWLRDDGIENKAEVLCPL
jgi:cyclic pyranopterin phosphate synthase